MVRPRYTGLNLMKKVIADPVSGVRAFVKREMGDEASCLLDDGGGDGNSDNDSDEDDIEDGGPQDQPPSRLGAVSGNCYTFIAPDVEPLSIPAFPSAFAMKPGGGTKRGDKVEARAKFSVGQLAFLQWCYNRGVQQKDNKVGPAQAQALMPLVGTRLGATKFPGDSFWAANPEVSSRTGQPKAKFRISELLDHWSFRPWFSQQKQAFDKKLAKQMQLAQQQKDIDVHSDDDDAEVGE